MLSNLHLGKVIETSGDRLLDDLIYSFLLQSDYPRAAIVLNADLLNPVTQSTAGMKVPSFIIVDPETALPLAVIQVVDAIEGEALKQSAIETGAYASRLANKAIQGFLIRVDVRGRTEAEQVQFYRVWPNSTLQQLSSKNFPDLDTLRVSRKLIENNAARVIAEVPMLTSKSSAVAGGTDEKSNTPGAGMYLPALVLLILIVADGVFSSINGAPLLSVSQSVLAFGAAILLTLPAAIRYSRQ